MAEYEENEELTKFVGWWSKHGKSALTGVLVAVVAIGGWYGWQWYSARQDNHAADMFAEVQHGISSDNVTAGVTNLVSTLKSDYSGTPYAAAAAMSMAAYDVNQSQFKQAASQLRWARRHARGPGIRAIATVRLARVRWAEKQPKQALTLLGTNHPKAFNSLYDELTGDIEAAQGDRAAAHSAYQKALQSLPKNASRQLLEKKLSHTAPAAGAAAPSTDATKSNS